MSLSTGVQTVANQSIRDERKTFCVLPELSCDLLEDDFHLNKSYPCTQKPKYKKSLFGLQRRHDYPDSMTGEHIDVCTSARKKHQLGRILPGSQVSAHFLQQLSTASETEGGFPNSFMSEDSCLPKYPAALNPNKVVLTVSHKTSEILSANDKATKFFECSTKELTGKKLSSVLKKTSEVLEKALDEDYPLADGTVASVSGKVVDAVTLSGEVPVSLCMYRPSQNEDYWLVMLESVERISGFLSFSQDGSILNCDLALAHFHGYHNPEDLKGVSVRELIPSLQIPLYGHALSKTLRVQRVHGKSRSGAAVPLCVKLQGAALCGKAQHKNSNYGCTFTKDSVELANGEHKQQSSPLTVPKGSFKSWEP